MHQNHRDLVRMIRFQRIKARRRGILRRIQHVFDQIQVRQRRHVIRKRRSVVERQRDGLFPADLDRTDPVVVVKFHPGGDHAVLILRVEPKESRRPVDDRRFAFQRLIRGFHIRHRDHRRPDPEFMCEMRKVFGSVIRTEQKFQIRSRLIHQFVTRFSEREDFPVRRGQLKRTRTQQPQFCQIGI